MRGEYNYFISYCTLTETFTRPLDNPTTHLSTQYSSQGPRDIPLHTFPTAQTALGTYDILYSPTQATPTPNTPKRDRVYQVLEDPKERGRDQDGKGGDLKEKRGDYSFLGETGAEGYRVLGEAGKGVTYEVPVAQKTSSNAAAGKQQGTAEEYSTLQHH